MFVLLVSMEWVGGVFTFKVNSVSVPKEIPSVANRVANLEDRGEKRKTPETTPTKSPAANKT